MSRKKKVGKTQAIASSARKAIDRLNLPRRKYTLARASGLNIQKSSEQAGISRSYARDLEKNPDVQAAYRELIRAAMPAEEVVELIKGGSHATMNIFSPDGKKQKEKPDWKTRRPYIQMAAEHAAYVEDKSGSNATIICVKVEHVGLNAERTKSIPEVTAETEQIINAV